MHEALLQLDTIRINFAQSGSFVLNIVLAFIMFGVALEIKLSQFKELLKHPKPYLLGVASQALLLPFVTFLLVLALSNFITPTVALGMILVAACPGGNISNFMTQFAKGNTELGIGLTATSTVIASFMTPFNFSFWGGMYVNFMNKRGASMLQTLYIEPWQIFETVFIILGIPLILGVLTARYLPKIAASLKKPSQIISVVFFMALVVILFASNFDLFVKHIYYIFIIVLIHNALALSTGYSVSTLFRLSDRNRRALTIETGIHNSGLGLVLLFNPKIFPPDLAIGGMLFVTAWWGVWHIVTGLGLSTYWSRKPLKEEKPVRA